MPWLLTFTYYIFDEMQSNRYVVNNHIERNGQWRMHRKWSAKSFCRNSFYISLNFDLLIWSHWWISGEYSSSEHSISKHVWHSLINPKWISVVQYGIANDWKWMWNYSDNKCGWKLKFLCGFQLWKMLAIQEEQWLLLVSSVRSRIDVTYNVS